MRHRRCIALLLATALAGGCSAVDDWAGLERRREPPPAPVTNDGRVVATYLATLDRLVRGGAAEQSEILQAAHSAYLANPSTQQRLRYAFVLAVPGHLASDAEGARMLLGETLATPELLLPSERALAELTIRELDTRLALTRENATLRSTGSAAEQGQIAGLNRRLQQETAEKDRLRRELEQAQAKLEAIAALEGDTVERKP